MVHFSFSLQGNSNKQSWESCSSERSPAERSEARVCIPTHLPSGCSAVVNELLTRKKSIPPLPSGEEPSQSGGEQMLSWVPE